MKLLITSLFYLLLYSLNANSAHDLHAKSKALEFGHPLLKNQDGGFLYASVIERLVFYKDDHFTVLYGGPVTHRKDGVGWLMFATFQNEHHIPKAYYEIAFVNCNPENARDAKLLYVDIPDANIKFRNKLSKDYEVFHDLCLGKYSKEKYVVIRSPDIGNAFYPRIYTKKLNGGSNIGDKEAIARFLSYQFHTKSDVLDYYVSDFKEKIVRETEDEIFYEPYDVQIEIDGKLENFLLEKRIYPKDSWKLYYIISTGNTKKTDQNKPKKTFLRLDSGCLAGQIYRDEACDCLDQLINSLRYLAHKDPEGLIIHIPAQDGRGFGSAPKAETEIYKQGGKGRVNKTLPLDTIAAANLLYNTEFIDIRTFNQVANILKQKNIHSISMYTDHRNKVAALQKEGIEVERVPTMTFKETCQSHINAKKNSSGYFSN